MLITRRGLVAGLGLAGLGAGALAAYATGIEPLGLRTTHYRLTPPGWPASQRLSIAVIADLHAGGPNMGLAQIRDVIDAAQAERADLIVVLGD
jgi:predicted MPP superfamily phosphohydrolase